MKLVLFDIDGTLLRTDGAARKAVHGAIEEVFGRPAPDGHEFDGKTDPQIVRELMRRAGVDDATIDERLPLALARYVELLTVEFEAVPAGEVLPGVRELLDALEARADVVLGLLTGNVHEGANAKLRLVGLARERFKVGAFGSDHADRPELPAIASRRAEELVGRAFRGGDVVVIGDTPADISCGAGIGARAIGVATGRYSVETLRACQAAAVFSDFTDTDAVVRAIVVG